MSLLSLPKEILDRVVEHLDDRDSVNFISTCPYIRDRCRDTLLERREFQLAWYNSSACSEETAPILEFFKRDNLYEHVRKLNITAENEICDVPLDGEMASKVLQKMVGLKELVITIDRIGVLLKLLQVLPSRLESLTIYLGMYLNFRSMNVRSMDIRSLDLNKYLALITCARGLRSLEIWNKDLHDFALSPAPEWSSVMSYYKYMIDPMEIADLRKQEVGGRGVDTLGKILAQVIYLHRNSLERIQVKAMDAYIIFRNHEATVRMPQLRLIEVYGYSLHKLLWWFNELESNNVSSLSNGPDKTRWLVICNWSMCYVVSEFHSKRERFNAHSFTERHNNRLEWVNIRLEEREDFLSKIMSGIKEIPSAIRREVYETSMKANQLEDMLSYETLVQREERILPDLISYCRHSQPRLQRMVQDMSGNEHPVLLSVNAQLNRALKKLAARSHRSD